MQTTATVSTVSHEVQRQTLIRGLKNQLWQEAKKRGFHEDVEDRKRFHLALAFVMAGPLFMANVTITFWKENHAERQFPCSHHAREVFNQITPQITSFTSDLGERDFITSRLVLWAVETAVGPFVGALKSKEQAVTA